MILQHILNELESLAPPEYQEEWDNSGLLLGSPAREITGIIVSLDTTMEVLHEAISNHCNLIVSHHPFIFQGIRKITPDLPAYHLLRRLIQEDIAVYALHTSLDNSWMGINQYLGQKLGLMNTSILAPKRDSLKKLVVFCPVDHAEKVRNALFEAGAGHIGNYDCCSYNSSGQGSFRASEKANPFVGKRKVIHFEPEIRIEVIFPSAREKPLIDSMRAAHPYEEVAFDLYPLTNSFDRAGSGIVGFLEKPMSEQRFIRIVKSLVGLNSIRHSAFLGRKIRKVAISSGAGGFLIPDVIRSEADIFLTSDLKYHQFQEPGGKLLLMDIGHYESESFMKEMIRAFLIEKFPNFAVLVSATETNPVKYFNR
jgi:dinuclear metal center YbgI/SA1388 family protein